MRKTGPLAKSHANRDLFVSIRCVWSHSCNDYVIELADCQVTGGVSGNHSLRHSSLVHCSSS